jgi:N-methylhydantoinase A
MGPDSNQSYRIGCDIGGTFTDIVVMEEDGSLWTAKADSTPGHFVDGVLQAIDNVAAKIGTESNELLAHTDRFVNGTTVVTNSIIELSGADTGLLTTKGFTDTLRIARSPVGDERDQNEQRNVPDIVDREQIKAIPERTDYKGEEIVALDETAVRSAVRELIEEKDVETIAVCFLWSFRNDEHERRAREIIHEEYPDVYVTLSHEIYPKIREYERMVTSVLNSYTATDVASYLDELESTLVDRGLDGSRIAVMQGAGGSTTPANAKDEPVQLIDSGPAGGVIGAHRLGQEVELDNIIAADMGGTSFDCSLIEDGEYELAERSEVLRQVLTGLTKVDITTIGAGGGSIASVDERGIPQVGPQSAGADPGPVSFGRGGEYPTLTDVAVVLGLISPSAFQSGSIDLDGSAAETAIEKHIAQPMGMTVDEAAAATYDIAVATMSDAIRSITVEKGRNPDKFTLFGYGGALPIFAMDVCAPLGIEEVVVPRTAPVFSGYGLLQCDDIRTYSRSMFWSPGEPVDPVDEAVQEMTEQAQSDLAAAGFDDAEIHLRREARFKFQGQLYDKSVALPDGKVTEEELADIRERFPEIYEAEYGAGTAWETPVVIQSLRVIGTGRTEQRHRETVAAESHTPTTVRSRDVYLPVERERRTVDIYEPDGLSSGAILDGPAIVEGPNMTMFLPDQCKLEVDRFGHYRLNRSTGTDKRQPTTMITED